MQITLEIPDMLADRMQENWENLPRKVLEILVVEAYKAELITRAEVGHLLNFSHRLEVDAFLKNAGAYRHYTLEDFEQDLETMKCLEQEEKLKLP